jgi:hypothetical protein
VKTPNLLISLVGAALLLAGCGQAEFASPTPGSAPNTPPPEPATPTASAAASPTSGGAGGASYPVFGHADDFSWIAGQVMVTRIQGGCTYLQYADPRADVPPDAAQVHVSGQGWAAAEQAGVAANGAFVVAWGRLAAAGDPQEMCPGRAYIIDRVEPNPAAAGYTPVPQPSPPTGPTVTGPIVGTSVPGGGPVEGPPLVGPGSTPPPPLPGSGGVMTPGPDGVVIVTEADTGRPVEMRVGDVLQIQVEPGPYGWEFRAADPTILLADTASGQNRYRAMAAGQTTLTGTGTLPCHHVVPPCEAPTRGLELTVIVR